MKLKLIESRVATTAYVQKSVRDGSKVTTKTVKRLGTLEEIRRQTGCADPVQWCREQVAMMTAEEKDGRSAVQVEYRPDRRVKPGLRPFRIGGDLLLLGLYRELGLSDVCGRIQRAGKSRYDLAGILRTLVMGRILFPGSKLSTLAESGKLLSPPDFGAEQMYRGLSLLAGQMEAFQAAVFANSARAGGRNTGVIFYDCTNFYFETDTEDELRRRGKSKEHRPNPIVQMGMFMDYDGIPLAFTVFPGNASEQPTLQPLEEMLADRLGLTKFIVSTDAGLSSEDNRRYNLTEDRAYICVQSLPQLGVKDQDMAVDPRGWRVAARDKSQAGPVDPEDPGRDVFDLDRVDLDRERHTKFYKEILVEKKLKGKGPRMERIIVTYSHDFALYLKAKREERLEKAKKIVRQGRKKPRQAQQDPRRYVETVYCTADGELAEHISMGINQDIISQEEKFDGFYAYGTSLDDDAVDILRVRAFHGEIEHLFRTTKSIIDARPVFLRRADRIKAHFLVCFLAMALLKILQKRIAMPDLPVERLIKKLREFNFNHIPGRGYTPLFTRDEVTDRLQEVAKLQLDNEITTTRQMNRIYKSLM